MSDNELAQPGPLFEPANDQPTPVEPEVVLPEVLKTQQPADPTQVWGLHFVSPESVTEGDVRSLPSDRLEVQGLVSSTQSKVFFRGGWTCGCVAESLPYVEKDMIRHGIIRHNIDIYQLGYNTGGVAASAGTHDKGMMIDVAQYGPQALAIWWKWGWAMQHRTVAQGFNMDHGHGGPRGCTHGSPLAMYQMQQYIYGRNGLRSNGPAEGPGGALPTYKSVISKLGPRMVAAKAEPIPAISFSATMKGIVGPDRGKFNGNVRILQDLLNRSKNTEQSGQGLLVLDGVWGPHTQKAFANFQLVLGFTGSAADGIPGRTSFTRLVQWNEYYRAVN